MLELIAIIIALLYTVGIFISMSVLPFLMLKYFVRTNFGLPIYAPFSQCREICVFPKTSILAYINPFGIKWAVITPSGRLGYIAISKEKGEDCPVIDFDLSLIGFHLCLFEGILWPFVWIKRIMTADHKRIWIGKILYFIFSTKEERTQNALGTISSMKEGNK